MFTYRLIGENDYIFDVQGTISDNRGIADISKVLQIDKAAEISWKKLKNIDKAIQKIAFHIENKSKILLIIDADTDGYTSASIIYQYIKQQDEEANIEWIVHAEKKHGIKGIEIPNDVDFLIIPDASSSEAEEHRRIHNQGVDIVVIDHHEMEEEESPYAIIVNPQLGGGNNTDLSAAGVVYKVCKGLDEYFWTDYADYYLDLVALGNIADSMSMRNKETRYYVNRGLIDINNDFFKALLNQQEYSMKGKVNPISVSFYISPLTNSVTRVGTIDERRDLFKAFICHREMVAYKPRGKDEIMVPFVSDMARQCYNIKNRQNRIKEKLTQAIDTVIETNDLCVNKLLFISETVGMEKGLTGLIANSIASKYKRPVLITGEENQEGVLTGSGRGYDKGGFKELRKEIIDSGLFNSAKGHMSAFGFELVKENKEKVMKVMNQRLDLEFNDVFEVDFQLPLSSVTDLFLKQICELEDVWGKDLEEPYILINNIYPKKLNIKLVGKKEDTISFSHNNVSFVMFKQSKDVYEQIQSVESLEVLGKAKVNEYKGKKDYQIVIEDYNVIDYGSN